MTNNDSSPLVIPRPRPTGLSRRGFLRGVGAGGAAVAGAGLLSACGAKTATSTGGSSEATDQSNVDKTLNVSNWPLYIDQHKGDKPTIDMFQKKYGIAVNYADDVNDNEEFFAKIRNALAAGEDTGRDLIVLTDWMAAKLISLGWVETIDKTQVPNAANLISTLQGPGFDPHRDYTLPWQSGLTGIGVNTHVTSPVSSISELLTRPDLKGKVTVLTEMRDTMGLIMLDQGNDPSDFGDNEWNQAIDMLQQAVDSGQIRQFTGNNYAQGLASGDIAACLAWSGDIIQLQFSDPKIVYANPDAGAMIWSDNMMIPNQAQHKLNAELWMNFFYDPHIAALVAAWVNYICPVQGAKAEMLKIDASLADNPLIFPTEKDLAVTHIFRGLTEAEDQKYTQQFQAVQGA